MTVPASIVPRPSIQLAHHRIHEGNHFAVHRITAGLGIVKYFLLIAPPLGTPPSTTVKTHLIFQVSSDLGVKLEAFEDGVVSANGTSLSPINADRNSTTSALVQVFEDPTVTSDGTKIFEDREGSSTSGAEVGEFIRDEEEVILKIGSNYLFKITPLFPPINITTEFNWYDARPTSPVLPA